MLLYYALACPSRFLHLQGLALGLADVIPPPEQSARAKVAGLEGWQVWWMGYV